MSRIIKKVLCILVCFLVAQDVVAGSWRAEKGIELEADFIGNVFLDAEDTQQETVLRLRPWIDATLGGGSNGGGRARIATARGREYGRSDRFGQLDRPTSRRDRQGGGRGRVSASIRYAPELRYYVEGTQDTQLTHFLDANLDVELVRRIFGVRMDARASQSIIDRDAPFTTDGLTNPENITDTYSLSISPYLLPIPVGPYAYLAITTDIGVVANSASNAQDSSLGVSAITLFNGRYFNDLTWSLTSEGAFVSFDDREDENNFNRLIARVDYRLNRRWQLNSWFGYDDNDVRTTRDINGFFWNLGATYAPNTRSWFRFGYGERFNEPDYRLDFNHRHRHTTWTAEYRREIQTAQGEFLERGLFPETDSSGNPVDDPILDQDSLGVDPGSSQNDALYLLDRFRFLLRWERKRTRLDTELRYDQRDDLQIDDVTHDWGLRMTLERETTSRSTVSIRGSWLNHSEDGDSDNDYRQWSARLQYRYRFSARTNLRLAYQFTTRDAENDTNFDEERINLLLSSSYR